MYRIRMRTVIRLYGYFHPENPYELRLNRMSWQVCHSQETYPVSLSVLSMSIFPYYMLQERSGLSVSSAVRGLCEVIILQSTGAHTMLQTPLRHHPQEQETMPTNQWASHQVRTLMGHYYHQQRNYLLKLWSDDYLCYIMHLRESNCSGRNSIHIISVRESASEL